MADKKEIDIRFFSADFWNGYIFIGGKKFCAGNFTVQMMNEIEQSNNAARLAWQFNEIYLLKDSLNLGYVTEDSMLKVKDSLLVALDGFKNLQPFKLFGVENERKRIEELFSTENITTLREFLTIRGKFAANNSQKYSYVGDSHSTTVKQGLRILDELNVIFDFYYYTPLYIYNLQKSVERFIKSLDKLPKLNENNLIRAALAVSDKAYINATFEYRAIRKSPRSKQAVTARRMYFASYDDFLLSDFFEGIHYGHYPKRCKVCGRFFLCTDAKNYLYCNGIDPNDSKRRTCRRVAAEKSRISRDEFIKDTNPIEALFKKYTSTVRVHKSRGKITTDTANKALRRAKVLRNNAYRDDDYVISGQYERDLKPNDIYDYINGKK